MKNISKILWGSLCAMFFLSCASAPLTGKIESKPVSVEKVEKESLIKTKAPELKPPEFVPLRKDISPIQTKVISISARNTPLRDVLYTITEAANLNLVMERGVNPELLITITLSNIIIENALNIIFDSVDYFYSVKDNMLIVKAVDTKMFELGRPGVTQTYSADVGGDILGATAAAGPMRGAVTQGIRSDPAAFDFWGALEKAITNILGGAAGQSFSINRLTGTIGVTASKDNLRKVEQYIETIKKVINRQVLVEAKIIEVQLSEGVKYGIDWQFLDEFKGIGIIDLGAKRLSTVVGATLPTFSIGVTGASFTSLLNALQQQGEIRTLSNPRVNIMNGQTALLSVGRNVTFVSRVETTTTAGTPPITTYTIQTSTVLSGVIIGIVPYIDEHGEISMTVTPIVSDLVQLEERTVGQAGSQIQISLPTIDLRELSTTVKVRDGQMIIIGGLISKKESLQESKPPFLGNVPILGKILTRRDKAESKTELVVVLQPAIVSM